jgi:HAE1 family hydrophobic/amphiphilic exporter-1
LALSGGLFGLFVSGLPISVSGLMGLVMLVGMVVNNAILLIDYTDQLRGEGFTCRDALLESGATRIRPILMTTLTTVLGLLPMAATNSSGTELAQPLAIVTIFGMMFSLFVTLVFIPVLYTYVDDRRQKRAAKINPVGSETEAVR